MHRAGLSVTTVCQYAKPTKRALNDTPTTLGRGVHLGGIVPVGDFDSAIKLVEGPEVSYLLCRRDENTENTSYTYQCRLYRIGTGPALALEVH